MAEADVLNTLKALRLERQSVESEAEQLRRELQEKEMHVPVGGKRLRSRLMVFEFSA